MKKKKDENLHSEVVIRISPVASVVSVLVAQLAPNQSSYSGNSLRISGWVSGTAVGTVWSA